MTTHSLRRSFRPALEALEDRCTPAGTVTGSLSQGVWRLTGDINSNNILVTTAGKPGAFQVTGDATTVAGVTNPKGVHKIVFDMKAGSDGVDLHAAALTSVVFNGGDDGNGFRARRLYLKNGLNVVNGVGADTVNLLNVKIGGNVNISNGSGGSFVVMRTLSADVGFNSIAGNVLINNGAGRDNTAIVDTNVGGSITSSNGAGDGVYSGYFVIYNQNQKTRRAVIGGNINVRFQDGDNDLSNGIWDAVVRGNVQLDYGNGTAVTNFDGIAIKAPTVIHGTLRITGKKPITVTTGREHQKTGLRVGGNFVIDVVNPTDLTLQAFNLIVHGQIKIV